MDKEFSHFRPESALILPKDKYTTVLCLCCTDQLCYPHVEHLLAIGRATDAIFEATQAVQKLGIVKIFYKNCKDVGMA